MCECVEGFTCVKCLGDLEAEWRYEHEKQFTYESEATQ